MTGRARGRPSLPAGPRRTLGLLLLVPAVAAVVSLDLENALVPPLPWLALLGLPGAIVLVALGGLVTSGGRLGVARDLALAGLVVPLRHRPPGDRIISALLAATGEELVFRLLGLWLLGTGPLGVALSSAAFGVAHLPGAPPGRRLRACADALLCGAVLAGLYLATGGVLTAVLAHFLRNAALDSVRLGRARRRAEAAGDRRGGRS